MKAVDPTFFAVTDDDELFFEWIHGDRHLTCYFHKLDGEGTTMDCFGSTGAYDPMPDFATLYEGYQWLIKEI